MKTTWQVKSLGEVSSIGSGNSAPQESDKFQDGSFPFFRTSDVGKVKKGHIFSSADYLNEFGAERLTKFKMGSILFPKSGASVYLNHRVMMDVDGYVSSHLAVITPNELVVCPAFLLYWLYTIDSADLMQDNDYPSLKLTQISKIRVPFPPLPEQERIVKKLDAAFEKIDTIQHNAERNLANAKELFQQVLDEEMTSKAGNKLICIKDIATVLVGYAFKSSGYSTNSHDIKLVCGDNIEPGSFRWNEKTKYWPHENATQYSRFLLKTNDVVLAMDRPWIKSGLKRALVTEDILPALLLQRTACLRTTNKDVAKYIYFILGSSFFVNHVLKQQTPGSVPHISGTQIESFPLYIPDNKRIHTAVQRINLLYETTNKAERHYQELLSYCDELKQQILAKAFNGEL